MILNLIFFFSINMFSFLSIQCACHIISDFLFFAASPTFLVPFFTTFCIVCLLRVHFMFCTQQREKINPRHHIMIDFSLNPWLRGWEGKSINRLTPLMHRLELKTICGNQKFCFLLFSVFIKFVFTLLEGNFRLRCPKPARSAETS